jgi:hypothetical protein
VVVFPNETVFDFKRPMSVFISRTLTLSHLEQKIIAALTNEVYDIDQWKGIDFSKVRLWVSSKPV